VALIFVVWWAFSSVEVVDMHSVTKIGSSKQVPSMTELNFSATLDLNVFGWSQSFRKNVVNLDFFLNGNNHMESTWMESYGESLLVQRCGVLKRFVDIVPNLDSLIFGAGNDQLFSNASIKTSNFFSMELAVNIFELWSLLGAFIKRNVNLHKLFLCGDAVHEFFVLR
jgi:hypothetical protein